MSDLPQTRLEHNSSSSRTRGGTHEMENLLDFQRLYYLMRRRWWVIAIIVGVATISSLGWVMRQPKIYESRSVLQVQQEEQKVVKIDDVQKDNLSTQDFINTIVQTLTSRNLMLRVIDANKLRKNPAFISQNAQEQPTPIQLAEKLKSKVKVALRRGTRLIDITVEDTDPVLARDLATSLVKEFLRENFSQRLSVNQVAGDFLKEEAQKLKKKLEESELKLQRYKEQNQAVSLEEQQNIIVARLRELSTKVTEAKSERLRLESDIEQVRAVGSESLDQLLSIASVARIPQVADALSRLQSVGTEFASIQERYGYRHPKYIAATTKIEALKQSLQESISKAGELLALQYESAVQTESKLTGALKEQEVAALDLNKMAIPFNVLQRDVESDRALYDSVIKRMKETALTRGIEQSPYTLVEEPMVANYPSKPQRSRTLAVAFCLSLILAIGAVVIWDGMDPSLGTVDDAEHALKLPALVGIPNHKAGSIKKYPIAAIDDPACALAEAYRTLRVTISMLGAEAERRILLFVSAIPEEGKTYTSLNSAVVLAKQGLKTLLIDADLRRPSLHKALLPDNDAPLGLTDFFSGNTSLSKAITPTAIENLSLLPAGQRAPSPAELLASANLPELFSELLQIYDRIIIDSAPINAVSDALVIAPHAHKTILVIRAGKTPRKAILRAVMLLRKSQAKIAGFVLNRLPTGRAAGYYYYYYGDKYEKDSVYGTKS